MKFIWGGERSQKNTTLKFTLNIKTPCDTLVICAADFFRVFAGGEFISYGPERTSAGYARKREISLPKGVKEICVYVTAYNFPCYGCDFQQPYFAAEVLCGNKVVAESMDFKCVEQSSRKREVPRYSTQRGFAEVYDLIDARETELVPYAVDAPIVMDGNGDMATYEIKDFELTAKYGKKPLDGEYKPLWWERNVDRAFPFGIIDVKKDYFDKTESFSCIEYVLPSEKTGFLQIEVKAEEETDIFATFEEIKPDGKWLSRRTGCNDFIEWKLPKGKTKVISAEPYAMKYLRIYYNGKAEFKPSLVLLENGKADCVKVDGDELFTKVFEAAKNSFKQNAVDIFMDCPGRERAGWLCDSYFTGQSERLFTGKSDIEKRFLENFIIADTPEIPKGMFPMCFPSEHARGWYIPNWAMWFVLELYEYFVRTGDKDLVSRVKDKVFNLLGFFEKYLNEYGLLENLESWVFIEWSICNDKEYVKGVNYPSNMLYALMLETVDKLYGCGECKAKADNIRKQIIKLSYDGKFFADNSVRVDGELKRQDDHLSETCQYYALFTGIVPDAAFSDRMRDEFGPLRKEDAYPEIGRSNMFIGNYLRFFWLCEIGEYDRVINESLKYFAAMAEKTGTLWEKDAPSASCNHGFASVAAVLLLKCALGYKTVLDGKPVFDKDFKPQNDYGVSVSFDYGNNKITVKG